ncbi:hypothetical protein QBC43DRAFT_362999 [Cladorrhinum sp. PSN259]|nr:hypothetical protein QBC43DRAFT_362999 [Cladorrhinum sp. PSN259]
MSNGEEDDEVTLKRRTFLKIHRPFVTEDIIRASCLKYLAQPKYGKPLLLRATPKPPSGKGSSNLVGSKTPSVLPEDSEFLLYSAKYWFQHCDTTCVDDTADNSEHCDDPPETVRQVVKDFISSSNFYTCMQVQSLFVQGYFLHSFDPVTGRGQRVRRTLPNWMKRLEPEFLRQYNTFQGEWCRLLKGKTSDPVRGDLSRCFWGALGSNNFLSAFDGGERSRYVNFCFASLGWRQLEDRTRFWQVHHITDTQEGRLLLSTATVQTRDADKQYHDILVEQWSLDGKSYPELVATKTRDIGISTTDTLLSRYTVPCNQSFTSMSLLPKPNTAEPPTAVAFLFDGSLIRIGSKVFSLVTKDSKPEALNFRQTGNTTKYHNEPVDRDSWEDVCIRDCFTVVCRRRIYRERPHDHSHEGKEDRRVARMKQRMAANERSRTRSQSRSSSRRRRRSGAASLLISFPDLLRHPEEIVLNRLKPINDESSGSSSVYLRDSDSDSSADGLSESQEMDSLSSAAVSCSSDDELSSPDDDSSSDSEISEAPSQSESDGDDNDFAVNGSDTAEGSESGDGDASNNAEWLGYLSDGGSAEGSHIGDVFGSILAEVASDSSSSGSSNHSFEVYSDSEPASDNDIYYAEPAPANKEPEPGSVSIGRPKVLYLCDACGRRCYRERYNCLECEGGRFDLCLRCKRNGRWCFDLTHKLYRITKEVLKEAISKRKCDTRQELTAYQTQTPWGRDMPYTVLFRFRKKYPVLLYNSPPVIHQKHDLVIWPLTNTRLLFGDLKLQKCYEQRIKTPGSKKAHPICVDLSFSPCGQQLRMAVIDAVAEITPEVKQSKRRKQQPAALDPSPKPRMCLNFHVLILQLSASRPAMTEPKLVASTSCRLGCQDARSVVSTLPFAFTWTDSDLYMTVSDSHLRVYRVRLSRDTPTAGTGSQIPEGASSATEGAARPTSTTNRAGSGNCCGDYTTNTSCPAKHDASVPKVEEKKAPAPMLSLSSYPALQVQVPKEKILLPRSSPNRFVQYFPPPPPPPPAGRPSHLGTARKRAASTLASKSGIPSLLVSNGNKYSITKSEPSSRSQSPSSISHSRSHSLSRAHPASRKMTTQQTQTNTKTAEAKAKATVIIGPSCQGSSRNPSPPIGVYLSEGNDLGGWIDVDVTTRIEKDNDETPEEWSLEGQFYDEEPFEQSDCILIPFDD